MARYAVATGDSNATATWSASSGGSAGASVPDGSQDVVIESGNNVTIAASATWNSLKIDSGGTLTGNASYSITLDGENGSGFAIETDGAVGTNVNCIITTAATTVIEIAASSGTYHNITLNASGQLCKLGSTCTIAGNLTVTAGTLDTNSSSNFGLTVTGDASVTGTLTGNASAISLGSLTINSGGTYTATSGVTIITSQNSNAYAIAMNDTGTDPVFTHSSGTVRIDNGGSVNDAYIGASSGSIVLALNDLQIKGSNTVCRYGGYVSVAGSVTMDTSGGTTYLNAAQTIAGNLTIDAGTLTTRYSSTDYALTVTGDVSVTGTLTGNASAISLGSLSIVADGTYNATSGVTTLTKDTSGGSIFSNLGTLVNNKGTITISGAKATYVKYHIAGAGTGNPYHLIVNCSGGGGDNQLLLNRDLTLEGNLTITAGELDGSSRNLTVHGLTTNAGTLTGGSANHIYNGLVTNTGTYATSSGSNNFNGGVRNLGTFTSNDTLTIGGTGAVLEGNLDDAIINVNQDPVYGHWDGDNDSVYFNTSDNDLDSIWAGNGGCCAAWIYPKSDGEGNGGRIADKAQWNLQFNGATGSDPSQLYKLRFNHTFDSDDGGWETSNVVPQNAWTHVAVIYDSDTTGNNPVIYVNGVSVTVTEEATPTGTIDSDASSSMYIGTRAAADKTFDGYIMDAKIYKNVAVTAAQVAGMAKKINVDKDDPNLPTSGLQAWWKFNASTTADSSGNSNNLTVSTALSSPVYDAFSVAVQDATTTTDGAVTVTQGKLECLALTSKHFDGVDDIVRTGSTVATATGAKITASLWFNCDVVEASAWLLGNGNGGGNWYEPTDGWSLFIRDTNTSAFKVGNEGTSTNCPAIGAALSAGRWYHLVWTANGTAFEWFLDGVSVGTATSGAAVEVQTDKIFAAYSTENGSNPTAFDGKMRDIKIFDGVVLSDDQIASLYSGTYNVTPTLWWKLDTDGDPAGSGTNTQGMGEVGGTTDSNGTLDLDSTLTIAANGTFNGPRGTLALDGDVTGAGAFTLLTGSTFTFAANKTFTGTSTSSRLTVDIPADLDLELVADIANVHCKSGTDITVVGAVTGCTFEDSTANIRQWHHTLDTQQLLDADEAGDDDLKLERPALDNALELMTG